MTRHTNDVTAEASIIQSVATREALHEVIDALPDEALPAVESSLKRLRDDPWLNAILLAPEDDEPLSAEDAALLDAARRGPVVPHEAVRKLLER